MTRPRPDRPGYRPSERHRPVLSVGLRSEFEDRLLDERERSHDRLEPGEGHGSSDRITSIDEALIRLREYPERYGACEACGASIDLERLQVVPWTRHCREHVPSEAGTHLEG